MSWELREKHASDYDPYPTQDDVLTVTLWITCPLFAIFLSLLVFGLYKYRPKNFDKAMLLILGICTLCLGIKAVFILYYNLKQKDYSEDYIQLQNMIGLLNMVIDITLWMMLFSFVFEMNQVAVVLKNERKDNLTRREEQGKRIRLWFMISVFIFRMIFQIVDVIMMYVSNEV